MAAKKTLNKTIYKRNFLKSVILRLDFDTADISFLSNFSQKILTEYPFQKKESEKSFVFEIKDGDIERAEEQMFVWVFSNATQNKSIKVSTRSLILEYTGSYKSSKDLLDVATRIFLPFLQQAQVNNISRLGLRYVNYINFKEVKENFKYSDYFNGKLLAATDFTKTVKGKLSRQMSQLSVKKEDVDITFNFGIWNNDFPSENTRNEFLMDIDCVSQFPVDNTADNIIQSIERYNLYVQDIFEKSITEKFRTFLNK